VLAVFRHRAPCYPGDGARATSRAADIGGAPLLRSIEIARTLARRRSVGAAAAALALAGAASGALPLLEAPGYELGEAAALLAALAAPFVGLAAFRLERTRPAPSLLAASGGAALVLCGLVALLLAGALARAALGPCSALGPGAGFLPLLALPSALLGAALAVAAAALARGRAAGTALLYALAALASLALSLRDAWRGPAAFVFDPLLGAWPGPLYDEALAPDLRVVLFRAAAVAGACAVALAAEAAFAARRAGARAALGPALGVALALAAAAGARTGLSALALSGDREAVARALGGRREGPRCTLLHPAEKPEAAVRALLADCEFHHADLSRALGVADPPRVTAFVYRSAEEKRRLVGAAGTEYAKPWLAQIHLVDAPAPHPLLRHELVHAVASRVAGGPLGVPARLGVLVDAGLVEGLAVALETPRSSWTVHEWSRAARDEGLLPDVRALVGPAGFWSEAPARAYTAAGSFLAFLLERHGAGPVREAYRTGDLARATGVPLDALAAEWSRFLDGVEVPPGLAPAARARLSRKSLFARRCAREVASLEARARDAAAAGRAEEARALRGEAGARSGVPADPEATDAPPGDRAWREGDAALAAERYAAALAARPDRAETRLLEAKRAAALDPALGPAARDLLLGDGDPALALARVARVDHPLAAYLVGRALSARGEAAAAVPELARAAASPLPDAIAREAALLLGAARCAAGDRAAGEAGLGALRARATAAADAARVEEALRRCAFGPPP
jgi:hypothetical protein